MVILSSRFHVSNISNKTIYSRENSNVFFYVLISAESCLYYDAMNNYYYPTVE